MDMKFLSKFVKFSYLRYRYRQFKKIKYIVTFILRKEEFENTKEVIRIFTMNRLHDTTFLPSKIV